jgi:transposase InsO family protein
MNTERTATPGEREVTAFRAQIQTMKAQEVNLLNVEREIQGDFRLGDGSRCYPLTIRDAASRYAIKLEALPNTSEVLAWPHFERAFREFGLPARIRSDNGSPFATKALGGLSTLSVRWIRLGIIPERVEPGHPEQNGREERLHLTMKQQVAPQATLVEQQRAYDRFRHDYKDPVGHTPRASGSVQRERSSGEGGSGAAIGDD